MRDYKRVEEILKELLVVNSEVMNKHDGSDEMESALGIFAMSAVQQLPISDIPDVNLDDHFKIMARLAKGEIGP